LYVPPETSTAPPSDDETLNKKVSISGSSGTERSFEQARNRIKIRKHAFFILNELNYQFNP